MHQAQEVINLLQQFATPERKKSNLRFFKTAKGQYGFGDVFLGVKVPDIRYCAKKYAQLPLSECVKLLQSSLHEERLCGLFILIYQYNHGTQETQETIFQIYITNTKYINNWDLVDSSAGYLVGNHLENKNQDLLVQFAKSKNIWERRIAMIATFPYIRKRENETAFKIAAILVNDSHDLIHKAVGWMLREIGKSSGEPVEEEFLKAHYKTMPRTMLRYAIERFPPEKRKFYLNKN